VLYAGFYFTTDGYTSMQVWCSIFGIIFGATSLQRVAEIQRSDDLLALCNQVLDKSAAAEEGTLDIHRIDKIEFINVCYRN
jgi:hypothetical protein